MGPRESIHRLQLDDDPIFDENIRIERTDDGVSVMNFNRKLFFRLQSVRTKFQHQSLLVNAFKEPGTENRVYSKRASNYSF